MNEKVLLENKIVPSYFCKNFTLLGSFYYSDTLYTDAKRTRESKNTQGNGHSTKK